MKTTFQEYNVISDEQISELWKDGLFVFDTNVLLNLYRYSEDTSNEFIQIISSLNDRVWIPNQVGLEFNKNRLTVITEQKKSYEDFEKKINDIISEIENKTRNPFLTKELHEKLVQIKSDIKSEVETKKKHYDTSLINDNTLNKINDIFNQKVGICFENDKLKQIYIEGENRYKDKIPPGYKDSKKPANEKFGDLILWKEILNHSKSSSKNIIFILDDRKEDWWLEHHGKTISPRPELLKEFRIVTDKTIHFYQPFQFLEFSNAFLGKEIKPQIIEEVKNHKVDNSFVDSIQLTICVEGDSSCVEKLIHDLTNAGYDVYCECIKTSSYHDIYISLPNIPDLERRLNERYILNLDKYNLKIKFQN